MANLVLIELAVKESNYERNYIRRLVRTGVVKGDKVGGVWLVDLDSLKEYEARMNAQGTGKHTPVKYRDEGEV